jgi:hypothetical protein
MERWRGYLNIPSLLDQWSRQRHAGHRLKPASRTTTDTKDRFWGQTPIRERFGPVGSAAPVPLPRFWGQTPIQTMQGTLDSSWNRPGPGFGGQTPIRAAAWPGGVSGFGSFFPHFGDRPQSKPILGTDPNPNHARHAGQFVESAWARFWGTDPNSGGAAWLGRLTGAGYFLPRFWGQAPIQTMQRTLHSPWNQPLGRRRVPERVEGRRWRG